MASTLKEILAELPVDERRAIHKRAKELIAEELTLRQLRKTVHKSQGEIARKMGISQARLAIVEKQDDIQLSTLRRYVEAAGGKLVVTVEMPGAKPVRISRLADIADREPSSA